MKGSYFEKELGISEVFSKAFNLFWDNIATIALSWIIVIALSSFLFFLIFQGFFILGILFFVLTILSWPLFFISFLFIGEAQLRGSSLSLKSALTKSFYKLFSVIWANIVKGALMIGISLPTILLFFLFLNYDLHTVFLIIASLLMVITTIFLIILQGYWLFVAIPVSLREKYGYQALKYSKKLVSGNWWRTAGYVLVFQIFSGIIYFLVLLILALVFNLSAQATGDFAELIVSFPLFALSSFFFLVYFLNLEKGLESKKEGSNTE